jgi:long-chain acyl-CoA synthetase
MSRLDQLLTRGAIETPRHLFLKGSGEWSYLAAEEEVRLRSKRFAELAPAHPILLRGSNNSSWVLNLLALLRSEKPVVLLPSQLSADEVSRVARTANARLLLEGEESTTVGAAVGSAGELPRFAVGFVTSGSTGEPKIALRSNESLTDEGRRFQLLWSASPDDVFGCLAPLCHAYGFGAALAASLVAQATLALSDFKAPRAAAAQIQSLGVTILALVPAIARALALTDRGHRVTTSLRIAMAGAGHTTAELSDLFSQRFGISLSRNYGSSETGALLASLAPTCDEPTGSRMPSIECTRTGDGQLWIQQQHPPIGHLTATGFEPARLAPGAWWATGDLTEQLSAESYRVTARIGSAIRRGGHTIQPREVEAALLVIKGVREVSVRGGRDVNGEESIEAHIALDPASALGEEDLRGHLTGKIAAYKIPNRWCFYPELPKTWTSKIDTRHLQSPSAAPVGSLLSSVQGYRPCHALLAARQVGLLRALKATSQTVHELAGQTHTDAAALALILDYLAECGIVRRTGSGYLLDSGFSNEADSLFDYEETLRVQWLAPERIVSVLRSGLVDRAFDAETEPTDCSHQYMEAFCGPWQRHVAIELQRRLQLAPTAKVAEVGRAAGRITAHFRNSLHLDSRFCALAPAPSLAWNELSAVEKATIYTWESCEFELDSLDLIVITNGIHWLNPTMAPVVLQELRGALRRTGSLAILDMFVDVAPQSSTYLLDWLTHGGTHFVRFEELCRSLARAGFPAPELRPIGTNGMQLLTCRQGPQPLSILHLAPTSGRAEMNYE